MRLLEDFYDSLYPRRCVICRELADEDSFFCKNCAGEIAPIAEPTCFGCGLGVNRCECDRFIYHFDGVVAPFYNTGQAQAVYYEYKFFSRLSTGRFFAEWMAKLVRERIGTENIDLICFVPTDEKKKRAKRFDHSEILAEELAKLLDIPLQSDLLYKRFSNKTQHKLTLDERFLNVRNAYAVKERIDRKTVLLVDDIKTTGATLDECARQLKFSGADKVYCVTALISRRAN